MLHFDLESDGLLDTITKIHCLVIYNDKTDQIFVFDPVTQPIEKGLKMLAEADGICGHNILGFDLPAIKKLRKFSHS